MTDRPRSLPAPEALLAEHAWARRLAQRLVRDLATAEDLAQEACVRALERTPRENLRAWLGGVMRNLARQGRRERGRRARREAAVARPEALPSAAESLERIAVQQDVVRALLALAEPYRSTVVLRFYEGLPPRRIAARQGVPVATVKTRLARGLAQLRGALDREHGGDGRSWALFLAPIAQRPPGIVPLLAGALAVNTFVKLSIASAAVLGLVLWLANRENLPRAAPAELARASSPEELRAPETVPDEAQPVAVAREPAQPAPAASSAPAEPVEEAETITGLVVDALGSPVAGVELGLRTSNGVRIDTELTSSILWEGELALDRAPVAISAADGRYALLLPEDFAGGYVVSQDPRWETVLAASASRARDAQPILVVAPLFRLHGRVVDPAGQPLAQVELAFLVPRQRLALEGLALDRSLNPGWSTHSGEDGRFALERLPGVPGGALHVRLEPFEKQVLERETWHDDELEIVLAEPPGGWIEGRVEAHGQPLEGAILALGYRATESGADGSFRLSLAGLEREGELCALARGLLPARVKGDANEDGTVRWPSYLRIELAGEALALSGEVVDELGTPLSAHEVWIEDPGIAHVQGQGFPIVLESVLAGGSEMRHGAKTDEQGRFRIEGLEMRDYRLRVIDPATALVIDVGPYAAGEEGIRIQRPSGAFWPRVRGQVLSRAGTPLSGARVRVDRSAGMVGVRDQYFGFIAYGATAVTGTDGSFELERVPREGVTLHVQGEGMADPELELGPGIDPESLRITVGSSVRLQVRLDAHRDATHFCVLDGAGELVELTTPTDGGSMRSDSVGFREASSPVVLLSDAGVSLVLYRGRDELLRVPLVLQPGGIHTLDL